MESASDLDRIGGKMSVYLYAGGFKIVKKSGVGQALLHQQEVLDAARIKSDPHLSSNTKIVHINTVLPDSLLFAVWAKRKGVKVVYYAHSTMEDFRYSFRGSNLFAPLFKKWILFCYNRGDIILTPTEYSRKLLNSYGIRKPIYSISNGIDTKKFCFSQAYRKVFRERYHLKDRDKVVISVGHMIERKGLPDYIALARKMPEVRFFWFGYTNPSLLPGNMRKAIKNAPANLIFAGYVDQDQLRYAYSGADVFAFLSKEETEGIVVLEALASEIPAVVRDIPVYDDWLVNGRDVYKADTVDEFARIISEILEKKLPDLSQKGKKIAEERNFLAVGNRLREIYLAEGIRQVM